MKGRVVDFFRVGEHLWTIVALSGTPHNASSEQQTRMGRVGMEKVVGAQHNNSQCHSYGAHRKPMDQIGRGPWCLIRLWAFVITLASLCLLSSIMPIGNSIQATIFYPRKLVLSYPRDYGVSAQMLWELRTEQMFESSYHDLSQSSGGEIESKTHPRSLTSHGTDGTLTNTPSATEGLESTSGLVVAKSPSFIEDIVVLPEDLDLFILGHGSDSLDLERISTCSYGEEPELKSAPRLVDLLPNDRVGVSCTRPSSLSTQKALNVENVSLELDSGLGAAPLLPRVDGILVQPVRWDEPLVYAVQSTDVDVVIYVKNLFNASRTKATEYTELENFRCKFGEAVETPVTAGALEVFRCEFPSVNHPTTFVTRVKVHLLYKGKTIPSVAYYEAILPERVPGGGDRHLELGSNEFKSLRESGDTASADRKHLVCSCTMIWNVAKFLKEWVIFNSDLGVGKFFLYDNNSEDDIRSAVSELSAYNVTRIYWPWVKTQEAGFSNCAIEAQRECTWILFTDVDEFLFPKRWLNLTADPSSPLQPSSSSSSTPLASLIDDTIASLTPQDAARSTNTTPSPPLGQISIKCRNFGPTGRTSSPAEGVTPGYTCRDHGEQRHKSLIHFPALKSSLQNVIHHFFLAPTHQTVSLSIRDAIVHHYKFQAWSEFEKKFAKRASTYVVDWKEPKNLNSKDRPAGLGSDAKKPPDWETSHCTINDTSLADYTRRRYGVLGTADSDSQKMLWELL